MLKIVSAKVTASPGDSGWVQVHAFSSSETEKITTRGQLFVIIASKDKKEGVEAISFEREVVGKLREEYYNASFDKAFDALKNATQKNADEFNTENSKIEICCCAFANGVVYSSAFGGSRVVISREGGLASILESGNEVIAASGFPKDGDLIVVGTKSFFEKIGLSELKDSLRTKNPEAIAEELTPIVYGGNELGTSGAIIIAFEENLENQKIIETEETPEVSKTVNLTSSINIGQKILPIIKSIANKIPKRNIYIKPRMQDEAVSQGKKMTLSIGIILLVILFASVIFGIRQKKANDLKSKYQGILAEATSEVDQAISLSSANPEESRSLFLDSTQKLTQIKALKVKDQKIDDLEKKIEDSRASVLGEYSVSPDLFLDLGLLSSGFKGDAISSSGGNIYILDKEGSRVVSIAIDTKKSKVVAGPSVLENPMDLASYETSTFVLLSDGIYLVGSNKSKVIDKTWQGGALIYSFAGNLYVLDKGGSLIYRYAGQSQNTFGSQQNWLSSSTKADFTNAISWGMNGAVYVLYPKARVLKYSLGSPQNFSITGVYPEIGNIDALYADPDNTYVYLLDKAGKRVVVIDKNGKYKAQYIGEELANATKLVVSEAEKKIILLTGEKLLSFDIK